jgi:tetratricopeptide (TPR) repeat protein
MRRALPGAARDAAVSDRWRPPAGGLAGAGIARVTLARMRRPAALALLPLAVALAACGSSPTAAGLVSQGLRAQLSGDVSSAASEYQQAIKLDQYNTLAHYDLGTVYDRQGNTAAAVGEYRSTLLIDPSFTDALFNLAVDTAGSDPLGAEQLYLRVIQLQPNFAAAWLNVGFILQGQGKADEARTDWAKAVALDRTLATRVPASPAAVAAGHAATPTPKP